MKYILLLIILTTGCGSKTYKFNLVELQVLRDCLIYNTIDTAEEYVNCYERFIKDRIIE